MRGLQTNVRRVVFLGLVLLPAACQPVGVTDQGRLGSSVFDFQGTGPAGYGCALTGQVETGRAEASNVASGACSACD